MHFLLSGAKISVWLVKNKTAFQGSLGVRRRCQVKGEIELPQMRGQIFYFTNKSMDRLDSYLARLDGVCLPTARFPAPFEGQSDLMTVYRQCQFRSRCTNSIILIQDFIQSFRESCSCVLLQSLIDHEVGVHVRSMFLHLAYTQQTCGSPFAFIH